MKPSGFYVDPYILLLTTHTNTKHERMLTITKNFRLVTQYVSCSFHYNFGLTLGLTQ